MTVQDQPLMIALVAAQFSVHALGWAMAAALFGNWRKPEGQFAGFWLGLAAGLMLYVPALPSGHTLRNIGDVLIIGAAALQHRGMALHWGRRPSDRAYVALVGLSVLVLAASLAQAHGHGWRVATVCIGVALPLLATAELVWRRGRTTTPGFAWALAAAYGVMALALLTRAGQALLVDTTTKISIDAPGRSNLILVILVLFIGGAMNLAQLRLVMGRVLSRLTTQAHSDTLTGAANRRGLLLALADVQAQARRGSAGYALLMVDVDHFKAINDRYGHAEGDRVLQHVAQTLREGVRAGDVVARWGGEEFCLLLPGMGVADAQAWSERIALQIASSGEPRVTISVGVAYVHDGVEATDAVIQRADAALYLAKAAGRNRVMVAAAALVAG